jgi:hypothetical protein
VRGDFFIVVDVVVVVVVVSIVGYGGTGVVMVGVVM